MFALLSQMELRGAPESAKGALLGAMWPSLASYVDGAGEILGFGLLAFVLALPLAAGLRLWYRLLSVRVPSVE